MAGAACMGNSGDALQLGPGHRPEGYIDDQKLRTICREQFEINSDWESIGFELEFNDSQIEALKKNPASDQEKMLILVQRWHDVLIQCNENAQEHLIAAFTSINGFATNGVSKPDSGNQRIRLETRTKIQQINFSGACHGDITARTGVGEGMNGKGPVSARSLFKTPADTCLTEPAANNVVARMPLVGALIGLISLGTVFRVGSKYVMTAAHVVLENIEHPLTKERDYSLLEDPRRVFINFHCDLVAAQGQRFRIKSPPVFLNEYLDVAVLEIADPEGLPQRFLLRKEVILDNELPAASIIGYGHPKKSNKHLDIVRIIPSSSDLVTGATTYIETNHEKYRSDLDPLKQHLVDNAYQGILSPDQVCFDMYMEQGSSGAPALCHSDPRVVYVFALITSGLPQFLWDISEESRSKYPLECRFEMGTRMSSVYTYMNQENPSLALELFD